MRSSPASPCCRIFSSTEAAPAKEGAMKYLHAMVRVSDLEASMAFYRDALGLVETRRRDYPQGRFTLVYLAASENLEVEVELTYNYDTENYGGARNFGHLAFAVDDVYATCANLQSKGVSVLRPPRDGRMAFVRSPDQISIELLQKGDALAPAEPWLSMPNVGSW
jgi:lactoylglutathione lyase